MKDRKPREEAKEPYQKPVDQSGRFIDDIHKCIEVLKAGGIILFPTDTCWSLGCDAINDKAVNKLFELKQKDNAEPITVLMEHADRLGRYVRQIPDVAIQLLEVNDKPMTIVYPGILNLAPGVIEADGSAGIRITSDDFCKKLISTLNKPLASTSANLPDEDAPENFREIDDDLKAKVDYIVKWRQKDPEQAVTASLIKVGLKGEVQILRQG